MIEAPEIIHISKTQTALIPISAPQTEIRQAMGAGIRELIDALSAQQVMPAGPRFTHHLHRPSAQWDFEICVPVSCLMKTVGRVINGQRPAMRVARAVHHGAYEGLGNAWGELLGWMRARELQPTEDLWEGYIVGPEDAADPGDWRTELLQPLR
jgi:effector-binding domain-containing protein